MRQRGIETVYKYSYFIHIKLGTKSLVTYLSFVTTILWYSLLLLSFSTIWQDHKYDKHQHLIQDWLVTILNSHKMRFVNELKKGDGTVFFVNSSLSLTCIEKECNSDSPNLSANSHRTNAAYARCNDSRTGCCLW